MQNAYDELLVHLLLDSQERFRSEIFDISSGNPEANRYYCKNDCALNLDQEGANKMVFTKKLDPFYQTQSYVFKRCISSHRNEAVWDSKSVHMPPPKLYVPRGPQSPYHLYEHQSTRRREYNRKVGLEIHSERMKVHEFDRCNT